MSQSMPVVLTIAGSDSGGGAGIQADLKTFSAMGVFGTSALSAVTAQNSSGVRRIDVLPLEAIVAQVDAVAEDMPVAAVKIGMLGQRPLVEAVAGCLERHRFPHVVLDPVMVASSGDPLLEVEAVDALRARLLPLCTLLTPNMPEAALLLGRELGHSDADFESAARDLRAMGAGAVLLKAGHREGDADDVLVDAEGVQVLRAERIPTTSKHGTGCTLSAAIAAGLGRGHPLREAVAMGKAFVTRAIADGFRVGQGQGVLHHFWEYYGPEGLP